MSMIDPKSFIEFECKGKSFQELLTVRDELLEAIYRFEKGKIPAEARNYTPSPEVIYQMNLLYLGELCKLISETYNSEVVWKEE